MANAIVMVVEDEPAIREMLSEILESDGYQVRTARNGRDALSQLRRGNPLPDVILLDVTMPVMDGITFRQTQLRDPELCDIPVIIASAIAPVHSLPGTRQLQKPFGIDELLQAVTHAVGRTGGLMLGCEACPAA